MPQKTLVFSFPELLPQSRREAAPGLRFLDPGVAGEEAGELFVRPEGLPLDRDAARVWLAQATGYAGMFEPGDLRTAEAASKVNEMNRFGDPTRIIIDDLLAMEKGAAGAIEGTLPEAGDKSLLRAQSVLLLAWERERGLAEAGAVGEDYEGVLTRFGESLGLEPEDMDELTAAVSGLALGGGDVLYAAPGDWLPLLGAVLRLLPGDAVLCTDNASVAETWAETGVPLAPAEDEALAALAPELPGGPWLMARCPGYVLLGRKRAPEDAPWLEAERTVLARPAGEGAA